MRGHHPPPDVSPAPFPCWGLSFKAPVEDPRVLAETLLEWRNDERWLILGGPAAVSETQLWTAWLGVASRHAKDTMRSHAIGAEFIRLIAGTHQIRIGFERAGLVAGDETAWLIHLPGFVEGAVESIDWPELDRVVLDAEADRLMRVLGAELLPHNPMPSATTIARLDLNLDSKSDFAAIEAAALAHVALADLS